MGTLRKRIRGLPLEEASVVHLYRPPAEMLDTKRREYRYKVAGPPVQIDPVLRLIRQIVRDLGKEGMRISGACITVNNLSYGPLLWPLNDQNKNCNIKLYAWKSSDREFPSVLPVSIKNRRLLLPLRPEHILVKVDSKWTTLPRWLEEQTDDVWDKHDALHAQRKWWRKNGKHFPLMDLPRELRLTLFGYFLEPIRPSIVSDGDSNSSGRMILGSETANNPATPNRYYVDSSYYEGRWGKELDNVASPNLAVLVLSKSIHEEALQAGWIGSTKYFVEPYYLQSVLGCTNPPTGKWLSRIHLTFETNEWFTFLGATTCPQIKIDNDASSGQLLQTPTLTTLILEFPNPYQTIHRSRDVWALLYWDLWHRFDHSQGDPYKDKRLHGCYKITVDWILTMLFPFIKHIPNVLLTGAIKTSVANNWDYILNKEYLERKQDHRTHGYNWQQALEQMLAIAEPSLPPVCLCPLSCDRSQVDQQPGLDRSTFDVKDEYVEGVEYDPRGRIAEMRARRGAFGQRGFQRLRLGRVRDRLA